MARKDKLKSIQKLLLQRRDALRRALNGDDSLLRELGQRGGGDEVDFALDCLQGELSSQLVEMESRELGYIENALRRIEENTYGKCECCNKNIPLARLQALPYATLCVPCKVKAEKYGIEPGPSVDWSIILDAMADETGLNNDFNLS